MIAYIVTEGRFDQALLQAILPKDLVNEIQFIAAGGLSAIKSLARSLLAERRLPVIIVVDADSVDLESIQERRQGIEETVKSVASNITAKVVLAIPELEGIFFEDISPLTRWLGYQPHADIIASAAYEPHNVLMKLLAQSKAPDKRTLFSMIESLTEEDAQILRNTSTIREIIQALQSIRARNMAAQKPEQADSV
jgi:hypothetical protein